MNMQSNPTLADVTTDDIVMVRSTLYAALIGCTEEHFQKHIQRKLLKVVSRSNAYAMVRDRTGEEWNIHLGDIYKPKKLQASRV